MEDAIPANLAARHPERFRAHGSHLGYIVATMVPDKPDEARSNLDPFTFRFRYFKGFADAELKLTEPVTLLIGRNGAGKSNALEGIYLLSQLAHGLALPQVSDLDQGGPCEVRGGLDGCVMLGENFFVLGCELGATKYELAIRADPAEVELEQFESTRAPALGFKSSRDAENAGRQILRSDLSAFVDNGDMEAAYLPRYRAPQFTEEGIPEWGAQQQDVEDDLGMLLGSLKHVYMLDPQPRALRRYARAGAVGRRPLSRDGHNMAAVLYGLKARLGAEALGPIIDLIRQVPEERFSDLDFVVAEQTRDVLLALKRENGVLIDARILSDGTLRLLAILAALETLPAGAILLLEDYDAGLHPSRVKLLTEALWGRCKERGLRVLATTHNSAALSALNAAQLRGVVVSYYSPEVGAARLVPLLGLPDADILLSEGPLGYLAAENRIEPYLDPTHAERRRHDALKWLESL